MRKHKLKTVAAASLAAAALFTSGCAVSAGSIADVAAVTESDGGLPVAVDGEKARSMVHASVADKKIAYVPMSLQFELTALWGQQFRSVFESLGADYSESDPANNVDTQVRMIDSLIDDGVDLLIIQNPDVGVLSQQVQRAHERGIYVVSVNVQGTQSSDAYVGADHTAMAQDLAERMADDCKAANKDKVAIISGFATDSNSIEADKGWEPVFEEHGLEVVSKQQSNYDATRANEIATVVLQQHPDLCGFAVIFDITALGAAQAVEAAGLKGQVGIYNFDASRVWCEALADGRVTAGAAYNASGIAVAAAYAAQELFLVGAPAGTRRVAGYVPHELADKDNYENVPGACYGVN
ncbi:sugar ABC transporter substrate-binding protein [Georgenia ruanii]|uniref:Substrate-binding domain-containing protein n=1 Tax=Georgenia ruanii TaxID=348442 RepID=A0A7J9UUX0_9MICO|nr:sugar ABC transporter substrate-binding protein [Georgenia ruanii]MPV88439.1 substrate-binding domain-containing protein [Georgenia ruanii]